ncbi:hypothetical protein K8P10_001389 [Leucobacter sp. Psy1]|uniref:hypothetical protein n=1 Tax=Leucobacter sp. Psy1 TaxID=2875729 RepID=UPI001CD59CA0|nr:hypothetical protein [Leucobacter sp. Psy1]UBH05878.1 hypothetical protein K8P10_001389 [Leucobacter sp. Psy1]
MSPVRMRFREVRREAARNLASGTSRALLLAMLLATASGTLAALDTQSMTGELAAAAEFRERGGSITILQLAGSIDGRVCDALGELDGVRAAGALSEQEAPLILAGIPQNPVTSFISSAGFATMLPESTGQQHAGLILPAELSETLGLDVGDPIHTASGPTVLGGTYAYPDDGRPRGMGYAAIAPGPAETLFDQCWVDAFPVTQATLDMLYTAVSADAPQSDDSPELTQHNATLGVAADPSQTYAARSTAMFPVAAFVVSLLVGVTAVWMRRIEIASALHSGVRKADELSTLLLEAFAWSMAGALTTIPIIAILTQSLAANDHLPVVLAAALTPALSVSGAILGTLTAALLIREQRLFVYFKGRS